MSETINTNATEKPTKLVFKAEIARQLLKCGGKIVDIKPDRSNRDRTVFCFENDENFRERFNEILNDLSDEKNRRRLAKRGDRKKEISENKEEKEIKYESK